jgi:TPR repeat protein
MDAIIVGKLMNKPHINRGIEIAVLLISLSSSPGLTTQGWTAAAEASPTNGSPRLKFAVLPFRNATGDSSLDYWRVAFPALLQDRSAWAEGVRAESWDNLRHALTITGWSFKSELDPKVVPDIARKLKLDAVVWGSFSRPSGEWALEISLLRTPFTNAPSVLDVKAAHLSLLLTEAPLLIAERLGAAFPPGQRERWLRHGAGSNAAWEGLARVTSLDLQNTPYSEQKKRLRQVLADEPGFLPARVLIAYGLADEDNTVEAEAECRAVIKQAPDLCTPHEILAKVVKDSRSAEAEAREALRLQPACPEAFLALAATLHNHQRWQELRDYLEKANQRYPDDTLTLLFLASARSYCHDRQGAAELLERLGDLTAEQDPYLHIVLMSASLGCHDFFRFGSEAQWLQRRAKNDRDRASPLKEADATFWLTLKSPLPISRPPPYTPEQLQAELRRRLTANELTLVVNPVDITPEIAALAKELTDGITNQTFRALLLFAEVARRGRGSGDAGTRTAEESLQASKKPEGAFSCQEFAKLFVALSRAAGLQAWMVHVDEAVTGQASYHDCAALFLPGQAFLVDPTWRLFFAPHRQYRVMDDLQAIAHHAMQGQTTPDIPRLRMGQKLDPGDTWTRLRLVNGLASSDLPDEAEAELKRVPAAATNRWDFWGASADIQAARQQWPLALADLQRALQISPSNSFVHGRLKRVYSELKDVQRAHEHAEAELRLGDNQFTAAQRSHIQSEATFLGALDQAQSTSREALQRKAQAGDLAAQVAMAKLLLTSDPPRYGEALAWMQQAADQGDRIAQENYARNLLVLRGTNAAPGALPYFTLSAEQGYLDAQFAIGRFLYEGQIVPRDVVAGCQWVLLASRQGHPSAKFLLKEMQLFLTKDELAEAQRRADAFKPKAPAPSK